MKLPEIQKGDVLDYSNAGDEEDSAAIIFLTSAPKEVTVPVNSNRKCEISFIHVETVKTRVVEIQTLYSACDIYRHGTKIWDRIPHKDVKKRMELIQYLRNR